MFLSLIFINVNGQDTTTEEQDLEQLVDSAIAVSAENKPNVVSETYKSTRIVNAISNETVGAGDLDFKIEHHFGDIAGNSGGISTLFGIDQVADLKISFDYGITDNLMVGIARYKGVGMHLQIIEGSLKYKILKQRLDNTVPISITLYGTSSVATNSSTLLVNMNDRMLYNLQANISAKFKNFSLSIIPTYIQRNLVQAYEDNTNMALGLGFRYKISKRFGIIGDYFYTFRSQNSINQMALSKIKYYNPLGLGAELETGGHVFHLMFMNNMAISETQYITTTEKNWLDGQFRWGFKISRIFNI